MITISQAGRRLSLSGAAVRNARTAARGAARNRAERALLGAADADSHTQASSLRAIPVDECWALLSTQPIGRMAYTAHSNFPVVVPVNFAVDGERIIIRTGRGPKHMAAMRRELVAFEVDAIDPVTRTGWSVVITGTARLVDGVDERVKASRRAPRPWAAGPRNYVMVIEPRHVSGRRLVALSDVPTAMVPS